MYNTPPAGGIAAGFGGAAATTPWLGFQAVWLALAAFTLIAAGFAVKRILPSRRG